MKIDFCDRRDFYWLEGGWRRIRATSIILLILSLVALTGCSNAAAADEPYQTPIRSYALRGALSLPPVWTAIPEIQPSTVQPDLNQGPQIPPSSEQQNALNTYYEYLVIGYSVEGRPLEVYQYGSGPRDIMLIAGIHGGYEWNTIVLADEFIEFLYQHPERIPPRLSIHVLRSLNPDGATLKGSPWGRGNAHHVDLNRNWDSSWSVDIPKPNCWDIVPLTAGPYPGSEPETQALMQYLVDADIEALISYHSAGLGIFAGGKPSTAESLSLAEAIAAVSDYPYPPIDIGCEYTGTMTDWAADHGVAAIDVELSNHWETDLEQSLTILQTFIDWRP